MLEREIDEAVNARNYKLAAQLKAKQTNREDIMIVLLVRFRSVRSHPQDMRRHQKLPFNFAQGTISNFFMVTYHYVGHQKKSISKVGTLAQLPG